MGRITDIDFLSASPGPPPPVCPACAMPLHYDYTLNDWDCFRCRWLSTPAPTDDEPGAMTSTLPPETSEVVA